MAAKQGRSGVEYSDVANAINALEAEGIKPTLKAIRAHLGTGSLGTILKHVTAYKAAQEPAPPAMEVPQEIKAALQHWVTHEVSQAIVKLQQEVAALQATSDMLAADNLKLGEEREAGLAREDDMRLELTRAEAKLERTADVERQNAELQTCNVELEVALAEARAIQTGAANERRLLSEVAERERQRADSATADIQRAMSMVEATLTSKAPAEVVKRGKSARPESRPSAT